MSAIPAKCPREDGGSAIEGLFQTHALALSQIKIGLDMRDMMQHEMAGFVEIAMLQRGDNVAMLVVAAAGHRRLAIKRDDQRGARHQLFHEAQQDCVARY